MRRKCGRDDAVLFDCMSARIPFARACAIRPALVVECDVERLQFLADTPRDECARSHIARLFLHPRDALDVGIGPDEPHHRFEREWFEHLDAYDAEVLRLCALWVCDQV